MQQTTTFVPDTPTTAPRKTIPDFAKAISVAEGFGPPEALPTRTNNPGNLVIGGPSENSASGAAISKFETPETGWDKLKNQLKMIKTGASKIYTPDDTIRSMAGKWTTTEPEGWAQNVAKTLGVDPETKLSSLLDDPEDQTTFEPSTFVPDKPVEQPQVTSGMGAGAMGGLSDWMKHPIANVAAKAAELGQYGADKIGSLVKGASDIGGEVFDTLAGINHRSADTSPTVNLTKGVVSNIGKIVAPEGVTELESRGFSDPEAPAQNWRSSPYAGVFDLAGGDSESFIQNLKKGEVSKAVIDALPVVLAFRGHSFVNPETKITADTPKSIPNEGIWKPTTSQDIQSNTTIRWNPVAKAVQSDAIKEGKTIPVDNTHPLKDLYTNDKGETIYSPGIDPNIALSKPEIAGTPETKAIQAEIDNVGRKGYTLKSGINNSIKVIPKVRDIGKKIQAWDWTSFDEKKANQTPNPDPYNVPHNYGYQAINPETGEVTSRDWANSDPILAAAPNRVRPEGNNITVTRALVGNMLDRNKAPEIPEQEATVPPIQPPSATPPTPEEVAPEAQKFTPAPIVSKGIGKIANETFLNDNPGFKDIYQKFVGARQATSNVVAKVRDQFGGLLGGLTKADTLDFSKRLKTDAALQPVRDWFDAQHKEVTDSGTDLAKKNDYLPQAFEQSPDEVRAALGSKALNQTASFEHASFIKDYEEAAAKGLTPKYSPLELMQRYAYQKNVAMANKSFISEMKAKGYMTDDFVKAKELGWQRLNSNLNVGGKAVFIDPRLNNITENFMKTGVTNNPTLNKIINFPRKAVGVALSATVPHTPVSLYHGGTIMVQALKDSFIAPLKALKSGTPFINKNLEYFKTNRDIMIDATRHGGVDYNTSDLGLDKPFGENFDSPYYRNVIDKHFKQPLNDWIARMKTESYKDNIKSLTERGFDGDIKREAGRIVNERYLSLNRDLLGKSKNVDALKSWAFLPPNMLSALAREAGNTTKAFTVDLLKSTPGRYKAAALRLGALGFAANAVNYVNSGKMMWDNPDRRKFDVNMGKESDGNDRWVNPFYSAAKMPQLAVDLGSDIAHGNAKAAPREVLNELSIPAKAGNMFLQGDDYKGDPNIFSATDRFGKPVGVGKRTLNTVGGFGSLFAPAPAGAALGYSTGMYSPEEAFSKAFQAPTIYTKSPTGKKIVQLPRIKK